MALKDATEKLLDNQETTNVILTEQIVMFRNYFDRLRASEGDKLERERELLNAIKGMKEGTTVGSTATKDGAFEEKKSVFGQRAIRLAGGIGAALFGKKGVGRLKSLSGTFLKLNKAIMKVNFKILKLGKNLPGIKQLGNLGKTLGNIGKLSAQGKSFAQISKFRGSGKATMAVASRIGPTATKVLGRGAKIGAGLKGIGKSASKTISSAGKTLKSVMGIFKPLAPALKIFGKIAGTILVPLRIAINIFETIKGAFKGFKRYEDGSFFEQLIGGILGGIGGLLGGSLGFVLDLLKDGVAFIAGKLGFENFKEFLDSFSIKDMINGLFTKISDSVVNFFRNITAGFEGGIGKGIANVGLKMAQFMGKILKFPIAVGAGAFSAVKNAFKGKKKAMEAFNTSFKRVMNAGDGLVERAQGAMGIETDSETAAILSKQIEDRQARIEAEKKAGKEKSTGTSAVAVDASSQNITNNNGTTIFGNMEGATDTSYGATPVQYS